MAPWNMILRALEVHLIEQILRRPSFHRVVRTIHDKVQDHKHGRNPNEPLRQGEATEIPGSNDNGSFLKYFVQEMKNQIRNTPTNPPPPPPPTNRMPSRTPKR